MIFYLTSSRRFSNFLPSPEIFDPEGVGHWGWLGAKIMKKFFSDFFKFFTWIAQMDVLTTPKYLSFPIILLLRQKSRQLTTTGENLREERICMIIISFFTDYSKTLFILLSFSCFSSIKSSSKYFQSFPVVPKNNTHLISTFITKKVSKSMIWP